MDDCAERGVVARHPSHRRAQPRGERGAALLDVGAVDGQADGFLRADEHDELAAAGDGGVEKVALEQDEVRGVQHHHHARIFAALALVDRGGEVGRTTSGQGWQNLVGTGQQQLDAIQITGFPVRLCQNLDRMAAAQHRQKGLP